MPRYLITQDGVYKATVFASSAFGAVESLISERGYGYLTHDVLYARPVEKAGFWHRDLLVTRIRIAGGGWKHRTSRLLLAASVLCLALPASAAPSCKVNVRTCTPVECSRLPGVGMVTGGRIAAAHPADLVALDAVKGIGGKKLVGMLPFVAFEGETTCQGKQRAVKGGAK